MSAQWPTSLVTTSQLYIAVNELQNNLSAGINASVTTISLNSTTGFPSVGVVLIDNEIIQYTGVSGTTLTGCTRGFDGTTAATHSTGAITSFAFCAAHYNNAANEIIAIESYLNTVLGKGATVSPTEFSYLIGTTSAIQTQLNAKVANPLTGDLAAGSHKITGMGNGSAASDAMAFGQCFGPFQAAVQATDHTNKTTTSSTFADTALAASITPTSASHRVKVTISANFSVDAVTATTVESTIKRGSTNIGGTHGFAQSSGGAAGTGGLVCLSYTFIDSPATTSATTYTMQLASSDNSSTVEYSPGTAVNNVIILEEIA